MSACETRCLRRRIPPPVPADVLLGAPVVFEGVGRAQMRVDKVHATATHLAEGHVLRRRLRRERICNTRGAIRVAEIGEAGLLQRQALAAALWQAACDVGEPEEG